MKLVVASMIVALAVLCTIVGAAQPQADAGALQSYAKTEKRVTELDWNLLQFNLLWHDAYGDGEYVKSSPISFDFESMTFEALLRVADKRDSRDPEPFFSLPPSRQKAELQGVADYLVRLLALHFPKVVNIQKHVEITFVYMQTGGGSSNVGTYRDGRLTVLPR
jgi:hypothetical protein